MASYFRSIFGGNPSHDHPSKPHSRSRSNPANFFYGPPAGPSSSSRLKTKRSNSFSATTAPSPLRYTTFDAARDMRYGTPSKAEKVPLYRHASYRSSEHGASSIFSGQRAHLKLTSTSSRALSFVQLCATRFLWYIFPHQFEFFFRPSKHASRHAVHGISRPLR
jgi:hypothetical protein